MKIIIILIILLTIGCTKEQEKIENSTIQMIIKENTLTNENMTIIVKNNTENDIIINPNFDIEIKENKEWKKLSKNTKCNKQLGYGIDKYNETEIKINWSCEYGNLEKGKYRLIKYLDNQEYLKVEFEV